MIDLRSDTFTKPSAEMRAVMSNAEVGDDVFGEDPTVNRLEAMAAELLGKETGVFVPSGTQSNLIGILAHCQRGDEYLVGQLAHAYKWEAGGAAVLGSVQPQPIEMNPDGTMDLERIRSAIKPQPSLNHFAHTKMLALENTHDGQPLPPQYVNDAVSIARDAGLSTHLDGARLFNAAVDQGVAPAEIAKGFNTVSVCLSKGLGAPVGSVLVGSAELIEQARRWRKMVGGGMRQAGILAAAGIFVLQNNVDRLADDHRRASELEEGLSRIDRVTVDKRSTNMVFVTVDLRSDQVDDFNEVLAGAGIAVRGGPSYRLVTHLDIDDSDIHATIDGFTKAAAAL